MTTTTPAAPRSQDDRMLAAVSHLSFLAGFWLVAPIAIYVVKRKESRFVAFYALQAAAVQILFGVGTAFFVGACVVLIAAAGLSGREALGALAALVPLFGVLAGGAGLLCVHAYAAYKAWLGEDVTLPIAGQLARAILNADEAPPRADRRPRAPSPRVGPGCTPRRTEASRLIRRVDCDRGREPRRRRREERQAMKNRGSSGLLRGLGAVLLSGAALGGACKASGPADVPAAIHHRNVGENVSKLGFTLLDAFGVPTTSFGMDEGLVTSGLPVLLAS